MDLIEQAEYAVVHEFRGGGRHGGAVALAALTGMNAGTLSNKVSPACPTHHLGNKEAVMIQHVAQDFRILYACAQVLNHVCIPLADHSAASDLEILEAYTTLHREIGETAAAIHDALSDRRITRAEVERIRREGYEDAQAFFELLSRLEAIVDERP